jgi:hypothetical protein
LGETRYEVNSSICAKLLVFFLFRVKLSILRSLLVLVLRRPDVTRGVAVVAVQQFAVGYLLQRLFIGLL